MNLSKFCKIVKNREAWNAAVYGSQRVEQDVVTEQQEQKYSDQFSGSLMSDSCDPMNRSMPGLPVQHQLPESTQTHACQVGDAIQPSHPLSSPPPAPKPSQHQGLFQ